MPKFFFNKNDISRGQVQLFGEDEKHILKNSIDAAFASDHVKKYLLQHVENLKKTENSDEPRAHQYKIK